MVDVSRQADTSPTTEVVPEAPKNVPVTPQTSDVLPPYSALGKKCLAEHYSLGESWEDTYGPEVETMNFYLQRKIDRGEMADSITAVKNELKNMEKLQNLKHEERTVVKVGILSSYMKFLLETEGIYRNASKYGTG